MKTVLSNLFEEKGSTTIYREVVKRISGNKYEVKDSRGNISYAQSSDFYPPGSQVVIENGTIKRTGRLDGVPRVYEV